MQSHKQQLYFIVLIASLFIVSIDKIDSFTNELVEIGKKQIPISRSYKHEVLENLEQ